MKRVRIASGAGFAGDRIEPALEIIRQNAADYIIFECLAERTIALAQKCRMKNSELGYNALLDYRMEKVIPLLKEHPVRIITNMGAANPKNAAKHIYEIAVRNGLEKLKIAVVEGDDVLNILEQFSKAEIMETGKPLDSLKGRIVSANAYIGGQGISKALEAGADIVVTGRVADPSLTTGALMYAFGKSYDDFDFIGKTVVAGHLLECGAQVTGGYYADPGKKDVPDLWCVGFPIINFDETGDFVISKLPESGGCVTEATVKEQLLYEIQDPSQYITPDVVADFSEIRVQEIGKDTVSVTGAAGRSETQTYKVSVGYEDGYIGTGEISYGGINCVARAELTAEILEKRFEEISNRILEKRIDIIGINSLYKDALKQSLSEPVEVRVRLAVRTETESDAKEAGREVEALYTNGPAGGGGARSSVTHIISIASILIDKRYVHTEVFLEGEKYEVI